MEKKNEELLKRFADFAMHIDGWHYDSEKLKGGSEKFTFYCTTDMGNMCEFKLFDDDFDSVDDLKFAVDSQAHAYSVDEHAAKRYLDIMLESPVTLREVIADYEKAQASIFALANAVPYLMTEEK